MTENLAWWKTTLIGMQMLFVAFGALVLVPLLTGLEPSLALFGAGVGTLIFHFVTKMKVPIFLGSSFAFIAPIQISISQFGISATLGALFLVGFVYALFALLIKLKGVRIIDKYLPAIVTGPVIMVIGLKLAPVAVKMTRNFDSSTTTDYMAVLAAFIAITATILIVVKAKGLIKLIPIVTGIIAGYIFCLIIGKVNFDPVINTSWFSIPWITAASNGAYAFPSFDLRAILFIVPVAIAPVIEHVGDIVAISSVSGNDYLKEPGLQRTLLGDGIAVSTASLLGGPPITTYAEVIGAVTLLKIFNPVYMRIAAVFAIFLAFFGKLSAVLKTIPQPVMGGIMIILFGMIAAIGVSTLIKHKVDLSNSKNLVILAVVLVVGIGDMSLGYSGFELSGIGLAGVCGIILNILIPDRTSETL
jgi:uracil permease